MPEGSGVSRRKRFFIFMGLGVVVFAMALPLLASIPGFSPNRPSPDVEAHRELVRDVVLSMDRTDLIGDSPTRGDPDARLVLFKFSDFQCGGCRSVAGNMSAFMDEHEDGLLYVYKHLPLTQIHPQAMPAARAAWAAQQQGQFWAYHDALFDQQNQLGNELYEQIAQELGLDMEQFNRDRIDARSRQAVDQDVRLTQELELRSTPTFVLNDVLVPGSAPMEFFERIVQEANQAG